MSLSMNAEKVKEAIVNALHNYSPVTQDRSITYGELLELLGFHLENPYEQNILFGYLEDINDDDLAHNRPIHSVAVVLKDELMPGRGYFKYGQSRELIKPGEDRDMFFIRTRTELLKYYGYTGEKQ